MLQMPKKSSFSSFFRMSPKRMEHLLSLVAPLITKKDTNFRKAIAPAHRLMLTLRFFSSGESQISLTYLFRMGKKTVSRIISETCKALYEVLCNKYLNAPKNKEQWKKTSDNFEELWQFPHVIRAIDWKHIRIQAPNKSEICFRITKDFSAFSYLQFVMLRTILYLLMLDNTDLTMIVLFLEIQTSLMLLKEMYQTYPGLTKLKVSKRICVLIYWETKYFH